MKINATMRDLRKRMGWTIAKVAAEIKIAAPTVRAWENQRNPWNADAARKFVAALTAQHEQERAIIERAVSTVRVLEEFGQDPVALSLLGVLSEVAPHGMLETHLQQDLAEEEKSLGKALTSLSSRGYIEAFKLSELGGPEAIGQVYVNFATQASPYFRAPLASERRRGGPMAFKRPVPSKDDPHWRITAAGKAALKGEKQ